jgi:thiol-disulfide isomerase/thioredoxin
MRKFIFLLVAALMATELSAQTFPMPAINGETLDGKKIDSTYFHDHLTLISFFYIGCPPCMKEIPVLNKLKDHFKNSPFQILAVAPHTPSVLTQFNKTPSGTRESIRYDILPECPEDNLQGTAPRCHTISRLFGVSAYPTAVLINRKAEILMTIEGFPMRENDAETLAEMIKMVEGYLNK